MSKIARKIAQALRGYGWPGFIRYSDTWDHAVRNISIEEVVDAAISGHIIKKSEVDLLRAKSESIDALHEQLTKHVNTIHDLLAQVDSRVHTVIPVSEHEKIQKLEADVKGFKATIDYWMTKSHALESELARRIDLDLARQNKEVILAPYYNYSVTWSKQNFS